MWLYIPLSISEKVVYCVWFDDLIEANIISLIAEILDATTFVLNSDLSSVLGLSIVHLLILRMFSTF